MAISTSGNYVSTKELLMSLEKHRKNSHAPFSVSGGSVTNGTNVDFHQGHGVDIPVSSPHAPGNVANNSVYGTVPINTYGQYVRSVQQQNTPQPIPLSTIKK